MKTPCAEFGRVSVTSSDGCTWTVTVREDGPVGERQRVFRLHGMDEIEGALQMWAVRSEPFAKDMRHALRFAGSWTKLRSLR